MSSGMGFILGILLIVIGLSFALLAYAAYLYRSDENADDESPEETLEDIEPQEEDEPADLKTPSESAVAVSEDQPDEKEEPTIPEAAILEAVPAIENPTSSQPSTITLSRDETTGEIVVKVDDTVYASADELKVSPDWIRVSYFTRDLNRWVGNREADSSAISPESKGPTEVKSESMIEQIDQILSGKLADYPPGTGRVRLTSGLDGAVRVYIGIDSYGLDEVPDPEIRALIQEAVEEWEAQG